MTTPDSTPAPDSSTSLPTIDFGARAGAVERVEAAQIDLAEVTAERGRKRQRIRAALATLGSIMVHAGAVVALGLSLAKPTSLHDGVGLQTVVSSRADAPVPEPPPEQPVEVPPEPRVPPTQASASAAASPKSSNVVAPRVAAPKLPTTASRNPTLKASQLDADLVATAPLLTGVNDGQGKVQLGAIRSQGQRLQAVVYRGGSAESEKAVERALAWILKHQDRDGGWNFDHRTCGDCNGRCGQPGSLASGRIAATSMALLPLLAAGETHKQGKHRRQIENGLKFLMRSIQQTPQGGMLTAGGGSMYAHSLATIVLCEAYAMTRDRDLIAPARAATAYILAAQDPQGGGWRYFPGQPGDTSVTGWAFNALKSADNAYQPVPPPAIAKVRAFLDYVQSDEGAVYGYVGPELATTSTSVVGLLCRMQLGWKRTEPALIRGVAAIGAQGPLPNNIYYNFYATQVMHHFGGPSWEQWNKQMRDHLVRTQATNGHEAGSWYFQETNPHDQLASASGGRLYNTSLATLTLEVYYRHLPLYGNRVFDEHAPPAAEMPMPDPTKPTPAGSEPAKPTPAPSPTASGTAAPVPAPTAPAASAGSGRKP